MITRKIIISSNPYETRVALLENGRTTEYFSETNSAKNVVTNIYKGTVTRVLPGMNSAFIDIGCEKAGFLFGGDVLDPSQPTPSKEEIQDNPELAKNTTPIEKLLSDGQQIICQVVKEPLGSKGPRISMGPKIPGRYLVLMPDSKHIGISRRIESEADRERLTQIVEKCVDIDQFGVIIRTAALEATDEEFRTDLRYLIETWKEIKSKISQMPSPSLLYQDISIAEKVIRDLYSSDIDEIICDRKEDFERIESFLNRSIPEASEKLRLYSERTPLFDVFQIDEAIENALSKKVSLPSGGSLVIERTEALTTIDINTGSYTGKQSQKDTILKTNKEAIPSIVEQLRLRNIGGIIIIDFIDMDDMVDREVIYNELTEAFKADRSRTNILRMSDLGIIQMTRKRTHESLLRKKTVACVSCSGTGRSKSAESKALDIIKHITKTFHQSSRTRFELTVRDDIKKALESSLATTLKSLVTDEGIEIKYKDHPVSHGDLSSPDWEVNYLD